MTVFKEVIATEQEAEQAIAAARDEMAVAISTARNQQKERLESEDAVLQKTGELAFEEFKATVDSTVKKIDSETEAQITAIEQRFVTKRPELEAMILRHFQ